MDFYFQFSHVNKATYLAKLFFKTKSLAKMSDFTVDTSSINTQLSVLYLVYAYHMKLDFSSV